jgi:hypothetical protein
VADAVKELITACTERACGDAPAPASRAIAFMGLKGRPEPWTFLAGTVNPATDAWSVGPVPRLQGAVSQDVDFITGAGPIVPREDGNRTKGTPLDHSVTPLMKGLDTPEARAIALQAEDPRETHFNNASCTSCHEASNQINNLRIGGADAADAQGAQERARRFPVPKGVTGYVAGGVGQTFDYNTRNFGYFSSAPSVSGRTVTETVEAVEFLNTKVKTTPTSATDPTPLNGPGLDCTETGADGVSADAKAFLCLRDGGADCFRACKPGATPSPTPPGPVPTAPPGPLAAGR